MSIDPHTLPEDSIVERPTQSITQSSTRRMPKKKDTITLRVRPQTIMTIALVTLVIVSALQAFALTDLKSAIAAGGVSSSIGASSSATATGTSATTSSGTTSLNDLPEMVGGC